LAAGYETARDDPEVAMSVAAVAAAQGDLDEAVAAARQANQQGIGTNRVVQFLLRIDAYDEAETIAGNNRGAWTTLRRYYEDQPELAARQELATRRHDELLRAAADRGDANAVQSVAEMEVRAGRLGAGIRHYQRAVKLRPTENRWRLRLVTLLEEDGQTAEALSQVRRFLSIDPTHQEGLAIRDRLAAAEAASRLLNDSEADNAFD
jgi:tetratricopeptide (TPR) repeat protein